MSSIPAHTVPASRRAVALWLFIMAALVFIMVVVGGITRLTESGLSMVEWRPVTGWLPPLSEAAWLAEFDKYKAFPEYQKINRGMSLAEFQTIYAWEFGHRLLGRIIGLAFFVPMVFFMLTGAIRRREIPWFLFLLIAGGSQGVLGWYMVQSGLVDNPDVSQYRLAAHLSLAVAIFGLLLWSALAVRHPDTEARPALRRPATVLGVLVFLQIVFGAFVAGTNAGFAYNTWPSMDGEMIPTGMFDMTPAWLSLFEDPTTIQFIHRITAYAIVAVAVWLMLAGRQGSRTERRLGMAALHLVLLQVVIGIATLLATVPVWLGALHQATALLVWGVAIIALRHAWMRPIA